MPEAILRQSDPDVIEYTPASADVAPGEVVIAGNIVGVATTTILQNEAGAIYTAGVFEITKTASVVFQVGAAVHFDETANTAGNTATDALIGYAVKAAAAADETVRVMLANPIDPTD